MKHEIFLETLFVEQFLAQIDYYEAEAGEAVAADFVGEVEAMLERLKTMPAAHPCYFPPPGYPRLAKLNLRRAFLSRFPFSLFFELRPKDGEVRLHALYRHGRDFPGLLANDL
jgi:hypothetical protein